MFLGSEGIRPAPPPVAFGGGGETGEREGGWLSGGGGARVAAPAGPWSVTGRQRRGARAPRLAVSAAAGRGEDRRRGGGGGGLWPRSPAPRLARPPPPSVQVPSASRRGGLKTLWGSPVRLGSGRSGPRGGSVPSSRLRRLGPRHPVGCAGGGSPRHVPGPRGRREGARPLPGGRRAASVCACGRPPPASPVWRGAGQVGTPWAPVGLSSLAPRARACAAGAAAGRPVVRPTLPTLSESDLVVSAGRPEAPSGDVPCQGGGLSPPLETRTTLSGGSLGSCVDEERS